MEKLMKSRFRLSKINISVNALVFLSKSKDTGQQPTPHNTLELLRKTKEKTDFSLFDKRNLDFMSFSMKRLLYPTQIPTIFNSFGFNPLFAFLRPREFMNPRSGPGTAP